MKNIKVTIEDIKRLKNEEKFDESIKLCEELVVSTDQNEESLALYIDVLFAHGYYLNDEYVEGYEQAAAIFEKIITLQPDNYKAIYYKGIALYNLKILDKALECYNQVIQLKPDYKHVYYNIGLLYESKHDLKNALKFYKKTLDIDPSHLYASQAEKHVSNQIKMLRTSQSIDYDKLASLLKASKKVEIRTIQNYLKIDEDDLDIIIEWCQKYDFQIDGQYLEINKEKLDDLIKEIDKQLSR